MSRRRYLVAYDISDPGRLRNVHGVVKGYGYSLQYSIFVCDLGEVEKLHLKTDLGAAINRSEDRVAIIDLGDAAQRGSECFEFMGQTPVIPRMGGPHIV